MAELEVEYNASMTRLFDMAKSMGLKGSDVMQLVIASLVYQAVATVPRELVRANIIETLDYYFDLRFKSTMRN